MKPANSWPCLIMTLINAIAMLCLGHVYVCTVEVVEVLNTYQGLHSCCHTQSYVLLSVYTVIHQYCMHTNVIISQMNHDLHDHFLCMSTTVLYRACFCLQIQSKLILRNA